MRQTEDIAPLIDIADEQFRLLMDDAHKAANRLGDFWTKLYGPNELTDSLREILNAAEDEWNQ